MDGAYIAKVNHIIVEK